MQSNKTIYDSAAHSLGDNTCGEYNADENIIYLFIIINAIIIFRMVEENWRRSKWDAEFIQSLDGIGSYLVQHTCASGQPMNGTFF